jgi:hypothetical protein
MSPDKKGMSLDDLLGALKRLEEHEARYSAIETALMEQGAAMSELIEQQAKQIELLTALVSKEEKPEDERKEYAPLIEAIKGIRLNAPAGAANGDWSRLHVSIPQGEGRPPRTMTITKGK